MSPNCSILASIFQNFPGGGMPPDPPSSSMLCTPLPNLELAPPFTNPRSAPVNRLTYFKIIHRGAIESYVVTHSLVGLKVQYHK